MLYTHNTLQLLNLVRNGTITDWGTFVTYLTQAVPDEMVPDMIEVGKLVQGESYLRNPGVGSVPLDADQEPSLMPSVSDVRMLEPDDQEDFDPEGEDDDGEGDEEDQEEPEDTDDDEDSEDS